MTDVIVRQAVADDLAGIWQVRYAVTENTLTPGRIDDAEVLEAIGSAGRGWVAEHRQQVVGFSIGIADTGNVWALFVHPDYHRQGVGQRLHDAMLDWFRALPLERLWLNTGSETQARAFYEQNGWINCGPADKNELRYERSNR